jgi:Leucine-rich repeat (LRR) protein
LRYSSVKDTHLTALFNLATLEELCLDSCPVSDIAICHLADHDVIPNLTLLDLADTNVTDLGMSKICKFKKLKYLTLFYCNISNSSLKEVAKLENLEVLNLDNRDISDEGLQHLRNLRNLRELDIYSCRISDQGCSHIASITTLRGLELCGGGITDVGCATLATLENLTHLNLSQNDRITNRGAAALAILANLRSLNLSHTRINAEGLRYFSRLSNLQSLSVFGCKGFDEETSNTTLQDILPTLRCIRLDKVPALDGMILTDNEEEELPNDDDCVGCEIMWQAQSEVSHEIVMQDRETDETSDFSESD